MNFDEKITPELNAACEAQGIKLNIAPDRKHEETVAMGGMVINELSAEK